MSDDRFTINAAALAKMDEYDREKLEGLGRIPAWSVDYPGRDAAGALLELIHSGVIVTPEDADLAVHGDDDEDGSGLYVMVRLREGPHIYATEGWSDLKNYYVAEDGTETDEEALMCAVEATVSRANACLDFLRGRA